MGVEDSGRGLRGEDGAKDRFPVGMRVLAVDDDPACLKLLDALLRKCQYHVTTTSQAILALKMLRENKNDFDLVISDVQMPDMDGFKLLECVGLEMDLPVIMLSAYGDTKFVMKGVTHGACDYLLKPVRIEELKNIWQHVIRRKKYDPMDQNRSPNQRQVCLRNEGEQGPISTDNPNQNGKHGRKRKDQNEEDEEEGEENTRESDDPSSQKKPRVVWSVDLHRKFVAAVNQLGIDKAFPKRILDLMNVEGLTRENVASHLQKYRLFLKRISSVASQQANMVTALGVKDVPYMRMNPLNEFTDLQTLSGVGRLPNGSLPSYGHGRLNSPSSFSLLSCGLPSGILDSTTQNPSSPIFGRAHPVVFCGDQNAPIFQGIPTSLGLDQLQQNKYLPQIADYSHINRSAVFSVADGLKDTRPGVTSSINSVLATQSNPLLLQENPLHHTASRGGFMSHQSIKVTSANEEPFETCVSGRNNENWQNAVELLQFPSSASTLCEPSNQNEQLPSNTLSDRISSTGPHFTNRSSGVTSACAASSSFEDASRDMQNQSLLVNVRNSNHVAGKIWEGHRQDTSNLSCTFGTLNPYMAANDILGSLDQSQLNGAAPSLVRLSGVDELAMNMKVGSSEDFITEESKSKGGFVHNNCDPLDDLMAVMITQDQSEPKLMGGEYGIDDYCA